MGTAIIFVCALAGSVIVATYVLAFSASALLVVVEGTAAGNDEVSWPSEPWGDIFARAAYLAILLAFWLIPAGFLSRAGQTILPRQDIPRLLLIALPGLWLVFPLLLFSSLRSVSGFGFLRLDMLRDLLRVLPATLLFYGVSALLAAGVGAVWYAALTSNAMLILAAAPATAYGWLVYARLLGRLAFKVGTLKLTAGEKKKRKKVRQAEQKVSEEMGPVRPIIDETETEPEKQPRPAWLDPEPEPYEFSDEAPPERSADVPLDGYDPIDAEQITATRPGEDRIAASNRAITDRDQRLTRKKKAPKMPERPMIEGILTFPFYAQCVGPMINVAFGWAVLGLMLVLMTQFNPL